MPSTQYQVISTQTYLVSEVPCLLQGITIHENAFAGVDYSICDIALESPENVVMIIRSIAFRSVKIAFPQPIYFSHGLYIESVGGIPTITLELL